MAQRVPDIAIIGLMALFVVGPASADRVPGVESAGPVPDFSGLWSRNTFGMEPPESGPGPVRNLSRRPDGSADAHVANGDYNNPILNPAAAEVVKRCGEISRSGVDYPNPSNQCWPMVAPYIFRVRACRCCRRRITSPSFTCRITNSAMCA